MTHTETFIKDAIAGGWKYLGEHDPYVPEDLKAPGVAQFTIEDGINFLITMEQALLDAEAWEAVGKTRGYKWTGKVNGVPKWRMYWKDFIDHLADGKNIEEALSAIT